jgi:serine/threonine protein kinase
MPHHTRDMPDSRIGASVGPNRIESVVGRGGMGVVYLAEHLHLQRKVALKVLALHLDEDDDFRHRFIRESRRRSGDGSRGGPFLTRPSH